MPISRTTATLLATSAAAVAIVAAVVYFAPRPTNLLWEQTSDLPETTPNGYTYEYRIVAQEQPSECLQDWTVQQTEPGKGFVYRNGIHAADGFGIWPAAFRCDTQNNQLFVQSTDLTWWQYVSAPAPNWIGPVTPPAAETNAYPLYRVIAESSCSPPGNATGWWECVAPFEAILATLPPGPIFFYMRTTFGAMVSPDAAFVLIGDLRAPNSVRLVPRAGG